MSSGLELGSAPCLASTDSAFCAARHPVRRPCRHSSHATAASPRMPSAVPTPIPADAPALRPDRDGVGAEDEDDAVEGEVVEWTVVGDDGEPELEDVELEDELDVEVICGRC